MRVKCNTLVDQLKQLQQNHVTALADSQEKADAKVKRLVSEEQKLRTLLEHQTIVVQRAHMSEQEAGKAKSEAQSQTRRALQDARELKPLIGEVCQLRAKCKEQNVQLDKLQRCLARVSTSAPTSADSDDSYGMTLGQQVQFQELKAKLQTQTAEMQQLRHLKEDLEDERERAQALKIALEIEECSASDSAAQAVTIQEQQERLEVATTANEVLTEQNQEQREEIQRLHAAIDAAGQSPSEPTCPDRASLEHRIADAEEARQQAVEERDALQCELWMQQGAHATEIATNAQAQRVATSLLQGELETQFLSRLERQRESDTLILDAHLRAHFLEKELRLDEELDAQRSRADALEDQLGGARSKAKDLQSRLAAVEDRSIEERLAEVQHAHILRIRSLEVQLATERRDHADARATEQRRTRRLEKALAGPTPLCPSDQKVHPDHAEII